jgi:hypothetical protein
LDGLRLNWFEFSDGFAKVVLFRYVFLESMTCDQYINCLNYTQTQSYPNKPPINTTRPFNYQITNSIIVVVTLCLSWGWLVCVSLFGVSDLVVKWTGGVDWWFVWVIGIF